MYYIICARQYTKSQLNKTYFNNLFKHYVIILNKSHSFRFCQFVYINISVATEIISWKLTTNYKVMSQ